MRRAGGSAAPAQRRRPPLSRLRLARLWVDNARLGWPERARGLHYWLGWEYALLLEHVQVSAGATVLDLGTGAHSIWPYLVAGRHAVQQLVAVDAHPALPDQRRRRRAAEHTGLCPPGTVRFLQADARRLPLDNDTVDAVTAVSTIEHVQGADGDRQALREAARVLVPGGRLWMTLPYRHAGSAIELDEELEHFQWQYSSETLAGSLIGPSGLVERRRVLYGERLPFYAFMRRIPGPLRWLHRPWDTVLSAALLTPVDEPGRASAVLVELQKPAPEEETFPPTDGDSG
jgi:SAM-dependent methyltransferase